jgi:hypothetical protein
MAVSIAGSRVLQLTLFSIVNLRHVDIVSLTRTTTWMYKIQITDQQRAIGGKAGTVQSDISPSAIEVLKRMWTFPAKSPMRHDAFALEPWKLL